MIYLSGLRGVSGARGTVLEYSSVSFARFPVDFFFGGGGEGVCFIRGRLMMMMMMMEDVGK